MGKAICFDMDGTIANLYQVENWKEKLNVGNSLPYLTAEPLFDMAELAEILRQLQESEWHIQIITWGSMTATSCQLDEIRQAKLEWLDMQGFPYDGFHCVKYGTTKARALNNKYEQAILIDDNEKVRKTWKLGQAIDPMDNLIDFLKGLM